MSDNERDGCIVPLLAVLLLGFTTVDACRQASAAKADVEALERRLQPTTSDVLGGPEAETFYDLSPGNRFYVRIDGVPIETYFSAVKR